MSSPIQVKHLLLATILSSFASSATLPQPDRAKPNRLAFGTAALARTGGEGSQSRQQTSTTANSTPQPKGNSVIPTRSHLAKPASTSAKQQVVKTRSSDFYSPKANPSGQKVPSQPQLDKLYPPPLKASDLLRDRPKIDLNQTQPEFAPLPLPTGEGSPNPFYSAPPRAKDSFDFKEKQTSAHLVPLTGSQFETPSLLAPTEISLAPPPTHSVGGVTRALQILAVTFWGIPMGMLLSKLDRQRKDKLSP